MRKVWLNGWQRLWLVLGVVTLGLVPLLFSDLAPNREKIYRDWAWDQWEEVKKSVPQFGHYFDFKEDMKEPTDSALVVRLSRNAGILRIDSLKAKPKPDSLLIAALEHINAVRPVYERRLDALTQAQAVYWSKVIGWWFAFMATLYLAGWAVGWVFRGFFPSRSSDA